ncbi:hypothetical protein JL720_14042 [Aureococcus anophagefferens]|nr:hypothetical protein JL720_14042 [Aureococcus anophagefferens]
MKAALLALLSTGSALRVPRRAVAGAVAGALTTPYVPLAARAADAPDALFPASIYEGTWVTERKINVQEGDAAAAAAAMKALGNTGPYEMLKKEAYEARFQPLAAPEPAWVKRNLFPQWASDKGGVVGTDRVFELESRGASSVSVSGDVLSFAAKDGTKHAPSSPTASPRTSAAPDRLHGDLHHRRQGRGEALARLPPAPAAPMFGGTEKVETFDATRAIGATPTPTTKSRLQYERPEVAQRTGFGR